MNWILRETTFYNTILLSIDIYVIIYVVVGKDNNLEDAFELFKECIHELEPGSSPKDLYLSALSFLAKCSEVGLYYS